MPSALDPTTRQEPSIGLGDVGDSALTPQPVDGRARVVVSRPAPEIDGGHHPVKRVLGDRLTIAVDLLIDGHTLVGGVAQIRGPGDDTVRELPLTAQGNDRFSAEVLLDRLGRWQFTVEGWVDQFATWRWGFERKVAAQQDVAIELASGLALLTTAAQRSDDVVLKEAIAALSATAITDAERAQMLLAPPLLAAMARAADRTHKSSLGRVLEVVVEPVRARFSAWYEFFPRSTGKAGAHGTFADAQKLLPYVAGLGFDIVYLPPIHPIGTTARKGPNNSLTASPTDPGSPWAIGNRQGGHKAVHPELGTLADFRAFVVEAERLGLAVALDIAFQASPDHPYVQEHPEWFIHRSDGSIQTAENPPKKYQDVYPFDFESSDWRGLWAELKSVFDHWIAQGVKVFRVDNPHTKPLPFWSWCLGTIKAEHPDVIFLAEAFTRPYLMQALAKVGFSQSYTYFTWRNTKDELTDYLRELTTTDQIEYLQPNFWPTTPDILPESLQIGGRSAFISRLVLAATLSSSYGIYGPAYELLESTPRDSAEELADNEKYQLRQWNLDDPRSLRDIMTRLNRIRRTHPALHDNRSLRFHPTDNERVICYSKTAGDDSIIAVVNLDPNHVQAAWLDIDLSAAGAPEAAYQVHDLLSDARYLWRGRRNYVQLDPAVMPAHLFRVRRLARREQQFEYYL